MAQDWDEVVTGDSAPTAFLTKIKNQLRSLRSWFSGTSTPANTTAWMSWVDTDDKVVKQRDSSDSADTEILATNAKNHAFSKGTRIGGLAGSDDRYLGTMNENIHAEDLVIISDTATSTSSAGTEWEFQVRNLTKSQDLFASPKTTTSDELAADTAKVWAFDQNTSIDKNDVLELQIVKDGSPTDLTSAEVFAEFRGRIRGS